MKKFLNKITLGDSYKLIKELPDKSIDCVYTDIPYLYETGRANPKKNDLSGRIEKKRAELEFISGGIDYSILDEFKRVLKKVNIFIWCSKMQLLDIMNWGGGITTLNCWYGVKQTRNRLQIILGCPI